jgi:hypothetical protein
MTEQPADSFGFFSTEEPPPFVDDNGQFVAAEFICDGCGDHVNVAFHPAFLGNMSEVQQWLADNAPCRCNLPTGP